MDLIEIGFTYREDLRKKYNLPEITDIASMEAYFAGIKEYEPNNGTMFGQRRKSK